jgi:hypothetical protein
MSRRGIKAFICLSGRVERGKEPRDLDRTEPSPTTSRTTMAKNGPIVVNPPPVAWSHDMSLTPSGHQRQQRARRKVTRKPTHNIVQANFHIPSRNWLEATHKKTLDDHFPLRPM